jgi:TolB protein
MATWNIHGGICVAGVSMRYLIYLAIAVVAVGACSKSATVTTPLAVLDNGQVVTMNADGSHRVVIADDPDQQYFQPIWSRDGSLIAYSSIAAEPAIHVATGDGSRDLAATLESIAFYFSFSSNDELALLRAGGDGLRLETTSVGSDALLDPQAVATGEPLYFSWSPEGSELFTHIGLDRLELTDGTSAETVADPGQFQAPAWTDRGLVAVEAGPTNQRLTVRQPGGEATIVATVLGPTTFVPNRDGSRIAAQTVLPDTGSLNALYQQAPSLPANRLVVLDTDSGEMETVSSAPVLAYFWSPPGDRLLVLDIVSGPQARWSVWSDGQLEEAVRFEPESSFLRDMVPFFDQYAQSVSLWAPDGSAFAFPGSVDGEDGIWVYEIDGEATRVSSGTWVSWSP